MYATGQSFILRHILRICRQHESIQYTLRNLVADEKNTFQMDSGTAYLDGVYCIPRNSLSNPTAFYRQGAYKFTGKGHHYFTLTTDSFLLFQLLFRFA